MNRQKLIIGLLIATIILLVINITSKYVPYINVNRHYTHTTDVYTLEGVKVVAKWTAKYKAPLIYPDTFRNQVEGKLKGYMWVKLHLFAAKYDAIQLKALCENVETFQTEFDLEEIAQEIKSIKFDSIKFENHIMDGVQEKSVKSVIASGANFISQLVNSIY
jgi:hypothetical protein